MVKIFFSLCMILMHMYANAQQTPVRIGIAGLTHTHVHGLLSRPNDGKIIIAGIAEPNKELAGRYMKQYNIPDSLLYNSVQEMLDKCKPEAVVAFNSIYEHLETVQQCAPRSIHVMVEKPMAVSLQHAKQMKALATKYHIELLTNYETTWYGSNHKAYELLDSIGEIRKMVIHDGHQGPKEIGVNKEFLEWLTDPVKNGGGALTDFGCYGANLITWLMQGQRPEKVLAVTQQIKPAIYPHVDDEATIVVTYPKAQGIIQASWNWPYNRKDMEVYGQHGYMMADKNGLKLKAWPEVADTMIHHKLKAPYNDPFTYFAAVIRKEIKPNAFDPSSLENNMMVMEILDAAKQSATTGKAIRLKH